MRRTLAEAKARFAECVRHAERGGVVVLTRHGRPVAVLSGIASTVAETPHGPAGAIAEKPGRYDTEPSRSLGAGSLPSLPENRRAAIINLLEEAVWPRLPDGQLGVAPDKGEREAILGYGKAGL